MLQRMIISIAFAVGICIDGFAQESDEEKIKAKIPSATAMSEQDWTRLTTAAAIPEFENRCLSSKLIRFRGKEKEQLEEFQLLNEPIDPVVLAKEFQRGDHRTFVKADRITKFTCKPGLEHYSGVVEFEMPNVYRGKFNYKAIEGDDGWQITEITMPASKIHIRVNDEGMWQDVKDENKK